MPPPVVGTEDALETPDFTGMTPEQMAAESEAFRERVMENARQIAEGRTPPPPTPTLTPGFRTAEPDKTPATLGDLNRLTAMGQSGLINMARMMAAEGKADWARFYPDIKKIVDTLPLESQVNSDVWVECYYNVKGRQADVLIEGARRSALGLEPPTPPPAIAAKPREFTPLEDAVIQGVGITREMYTDAEKKLAEGFQPFTTDNRRGARK